MKGVTFRITLMALVFTLIFTSLAFASTGTKGIGDDVIKVLQGEGESVLGDGVQNTIAGISMDAFNIARYIVIGVLVISLFLTFSKFSQAGDDPQLKARLKGKLLWTAGGLILAINFWAIYNFLTEINLGLKSK